MENHFLSDFKFEVFISYARSNNSRAMDGSPGWVSQFKLQLEQVLASRCPGVRIYFDDGDLLGDENPDQCAADAALSATFLVVLSPLYLSRNFCHAELAAYLKQNGNTRIFCVLLDDVAVDERPQELKTVGYDFQHRDPITPTNRRPMRLAEDVAQQQLYKLAGEIELRLRSLKSASATEFTAKADESTIVDVLKLPNRGGHFFGRAREFSQIKFAVGNPNAPLIEVVAKGGEGKTSLLLQWIVNCSNDGWGRSRKVFGWSFYSQGVNENEASSDLFFEEALRFFGYLGEIPLSPHERGKRLAERIALSNGLLIVDGVEPLQHPPGPNGGALKDAGVRTLLRSIAFSQSRGAVVLTTRLHITDLDEFRQSRVESIELPSLETESARQILRSSSVASTDDELDEIANSLGRHALSVQLSAHYIREALDGNASRWQEQCLAEQDEAEGGHAFRVLKSYETWFSRDQDEKQGIGVQLLEMVSLLGLFDRPVRRDVFFKLYDPQHSCELTKELAGKNETHLRRVLTSLADLGLVQFSPGASPYVDCHPLVRQYFADRLLDFGKAPNRKMHSVVFEELQTLAPELPANARENAVLFQAVRHGVLAGKYQQAVSLYEKRINHSTATYVWLRLGQYSDVINCMSNFIRRFPDVPLGSLDKSDQRLVMNQMGCALMAAGRPRDAAKALVKNVTIIHEDDRDGSSAATNLNNVAECLFFLGSPFLLAKFSTHAASAIEWAIKHGRATGTPPNEIPWGIGLNARLLYGISLGHAGFLTESIRALDITEAWFRKCYQNADQLYVTQLRYWRSCLLTNCLHGLAEVNLRLVRRVERILSEEHAHAIPDNQDCFGPYDMGAFYLSQADLRLSLLIAMVEGRIARPALIASNTNGFHVQMITQIEGDLKEADQRMSMIANRLWMGLIQTRQLQLARVKEALGMPLSDTFDFDATLAEIMLLSNREGLRLHATDALLEQAHRARLRGDEPMIAHCLNQIDVFETTVVPHPFKVQWPESAPEPFATGVPADFRFQHRQREIVALTKTT